MSRWGGEQVSDVVRWCDGGGGDRCHMWWLSSATHRCASVGGGGCDGHRHCIGGDYGGDGGGGCGGHGGCRHCITLAEVAMVAMVVVVMVVVTKSVIVIKY